MVLFCNTQTMLLLDVIQNGDYFFCGVNFYQKKTSITVSACIKIGRTLKMIRHPYK